MTAPRPIVVGLGELLWDLFPRGKQLGGAPANFAYTTALLGDSGIVASRIGDDRLGQEALWHLESTSTLTVPVGCTRSGCTWWTSKPLDLRCHKASWPRRSSPMRLATMPLSPSNAVV